MSKLYLSLILTLFLIGYFGINSKYRSRFLEVSSTILIIAILVLFSGFRSEYSIGDTSAYSHSYKLVGAQTSFVLAARDIGFNAMVYLLNQISKNPQLLIFISALFINIFNVLTLKKYSKPFEVGIFLYLATTIFYVTMNGMRQAMAASLLFWAVTFINKRRFIHYLICVFIAASLHESAVIFIPLYFILKQKAWNRVFYFTAGSFLAAFILFRPFIGVFIDMIENTQFNTYANDISNGGSSVNVIRVVIFFIPLFLTYIYRNRLEKIFPEYHVFVYLSLFNFIFMLFGIHYLYFYRLCMYFELANLVLIPAAIRAMDIKTGTPIYVYLLACYTLFCWYQIQLWDDTYINILFS